MHKQEAEMLAASLSHRILRVESGDGRVEAFWVRRGIAKSSGSNFPPSRLLANNRTTCGVGRC